MNILGHRFDLGFVRTGGRHLSASRTLYRSGTLASYTLWIGPIMAILLVEAE